MSGGAGVGPSVSPWSTPAALPALPTQEVHVWRAVRGAFAAALPACHAALDDGERARAARFHFDRDRERFAVAHAVKRRLLAHYAARPAAALAFVVGAHGKPSIVASDVAFNMTDTADLTLVALARGREVGVDAEVHAPDMDDEERALTGESAFSPNERAAIAAAPAHDRAARFFRTWSRKEAYIKATGDGIIPGLDHFDVASDADDARLLADRRTPGAVARWAMVALAPGPAIEGALVWDAAVPPAITQVRCLDATPALLGLA